MSSSKTASKTKSTRKTITNTSNEQGVRIGSVTQGLQGGDLGGLLSGIQGIVGASVTRAQAAVSRNGAMSGPGGALGPASGVPSSTLLIGGGLVLAALFFLARR